MTDTRRKRPSRDERPPQSASLDSLPPPPPYKEAATPPLLSMTEVMTTTEVITTTQTTTHFFSLPLWRKRGGHPSGNANGGVPGVDENGVMRRPLTTLGVPFVDKALPPTPYDDPYPRTSTPSRLPNRSSDTLHPSHDDHARRSRPSSPVQRPSMEPRRSTAALVHAALGIGLPAVLPQMAGPSSLNPESITAPAPTDRIASDGLRGSVRRAKSTRALAKKRAAPDPVYSSDGETSPRTRKNSFATSIFTSTPGAKGKGKARANVDVEVDEPDTIHPVKSISRRPSFWSRKKSLPAPVQTVAPPTNAHDLDTSPILPSLPPLSPFLMNSRMTASPEPQDGFGDSRAATPPHGRRRRSISLTPPMLNSVIKSVASTSHSRRPSTSHAVASPSPIRTSFFIPPASPEASPVPSPLVDKSFSNSPSIHATQRRQRAQTNPPILHRLSLNLFSLSSSSSSPVRTHSSHPASARASPPPILPTTSSSIPKPHGGEESPEVYLSRLRMTVSKAEIARVLASSSDPFHTRTLQTYIDQFDFTSDPLDVALRKLLMDVGLPRETQQIDRVIEAFATRYKQCNPNLYTSEDHPYILAFSLIMLHTDAFNKSNKRKMTKADYIKNTRLPGVASEVLDCFYDNIVFAPFIFIEDPLDINGQRGLVSDSANRLSSASSLVATSTPISKSNKVDPYFLIINGLLDPLRVNVEAYVPSISPYSYQGTQGAWDAEELRRAFSKASVLEVGVSDPSRQTPLFTHTMAVAPSPLIGNIAAVPDALVTSPDEVWTLKVAKVALLNRKDDLVPGGKRALNRKWRFWSVILTGSQLLFFRDPSWATTLVSQFESSDGQVLYPHAAIFRPDELYSVRDSVIVHDKSYVKHPHTLRFVMSNGRQFLLQVNNDAEMNSWLSRINYASAFKTAGIRMRPLSISDRDVELAGVAAATSHLHDLQHTAAIPQFNKSAVDGIAPSSRPVRSLTTMSDRSDWETDVPRAPEVDGADQLKATFDQIKAELAAQDASPSDGHTQAPENPRLVSRSQVIRSKIVELDSQLSTAQAQLAVDIRFARNVAILTPFQKATRDRLELAIQSISKRVMQVRLDIARLTCHKDVLSSDLKADLEDWQRTRLTALKAANDTIQSKTLPTMTLSCHDGDETSSPISAQPTLSLCLHRPQSSTRESFHSAIDFSSERSSFEVSQGLLGCSGSGSSHSLPDLASPSRKNESPPSPALSERNSPNIATPRSSTDTHTHEKFYTAQETLEEAEDWDKTKCAQRVSLVRLPSDIRLSPLYEKYHRSPS